jgi:hypothetical protein
MMNQEKSINSLRELQKLVPRLLKETAGNESLLLAAAANPLLALEQLGYQVTPTAAREIELRARFGSEGATVYEETEAALYAAAGTTFDAGDPDAVSRVLETLLEERYEGKEEPAPKAAQRSLTPARRRKLLEVARTPPAGPPGYAPRSEPLAEFSDAHPIIPLLIRWRQMEHQSPPFASQQMFERILAGELELPITAVEFKLQPRARRRNR